MDDKITADCIQPMPNPPWSTITVLMLHVDGLQVDWLQLWLILIIQILVNMHC